MEPAIDPFHPVLRILERYRSDVHYLRPSPGEAALPAIEAHLGRELPNTLRAFLRRWNGATLFRGALRVRSIADLAPPMPEVSEVILFADGPGDDDRWGLCETEFGHVFGRWDGQRLQPLHEHFNRWLLAQSRILDENHRDADAQLRVRLEVDPENGHLVHAEGERLLGAGDVEGATRAFRRATALHPQHAAAWQRLGESLLGGERGPAMNALVMALRASSLPLPFPGAPIADRGLLRVMESLFPPGDAGWERELVHFLDERCVDARHGEGGDLVEGAALALVRCRLARGERHSARQALLDARARAQGFTTPPDMPEVLLALCALHADLGDHDEAEEVLRRVRKHPDPAVRARGEVQLARIALTREEPWVDEIARGALAHLRLPEDQVDALCVLAERGDRGALAEAQRLCAAMNDPLRSARVSLLHGDRLRDEGDRAGATRAYLAAEADPESMARARLRLGDLCDDPAEAMPHYVAATEAFRALQLPLREAWSRLRLLRGGDASQAEQALRAFRDAGLAAGVATAEAALGRMSLDWHLALSADLARQRYDAQRMRPPLQRADADRPERRILAHRGAIGRGDKALVAALAADIQQELRRLNESDGRARDPAAMRFVAGVDLLAGHPSYDAAQVFLALLGQDVHQDVAARALVGAMARSPNMTLVEGLLAACNAATEPRVLAMIVEVLGWRREQEAAPRLRELAVSGSLPVRRAAITALGRIGDEAAVEILLPGLEDGDLAEATSVALLLLGEWQGVAFHGQALSRLAQDRDALRLERSPGEIVGRFGGTGHYLVLLHAAEREGAVGVGAIAGLGLLGTTRAVSKLIGWVADRDLQRQQVANTALELLLGHREDLDASHAKQRWEAWWTDNAGRFHDGVRYRHGQPLGVRAMIERLGQDDPASRQAAYDELVIATGQRLPFDVEGPWRMQLQHREAWTRWYRDHAHELPQSGWSFHGAEVA